MWVWDQSSFLAFFRIVETTVMNILVKKNPDVTFDLNSGNSPDWCFTSSGESCPPKYLLDMKLNNLNSFSLYGRHVTPVLPTYVCLCIYMHVCTHMFDIYIYIRVYVYMYIYIRVYVCVYTYIHIHMYVYIYICIRIYMYIYIFLFLHTRIYTQTYLNLYTHTHTHTHTYIHSIHTHTITLTHTYLYI